MPRRLTSQLLVLLAFAISSCLLPGARAAASPQDSSADSSSSSIAQAAQRSREKAKNSSKPSKVITDDDLDTKRITPGQQGLATGAPAKLETHPPDADSVAAAKISSTTPHDDATKREPGDNAEIKRAKAALAIAEKDLDLLQRDLALQQDTYFSNADYAHDLSGKARIEAMRGQADTKRVEVERLKAQLATLEEKFGKSEPAVPDKNGTPATEDSTDQAPSRP